MMKQGIQDIAYSPLVFQSAKATNTRFMGVVGLVAYWRDAAQRTVVQVYHLDYESYGIDGFYHLIDPDEDALQTIIMGVTGGLGGQFVPIDFEAFKFLVKSAYVVDESCLDSLVDFEYFEDIFESLYVNLSLEEEMALYSHLMPELETPEQLIHYFVMRCVGCDFPATLLLWQDGDIDDRFEICDMPQTLIKNSCQRVEDVQGCARYHVEAILDDESRYKLAVLDIFVDLATFKVRRASLVQTMSLSSIEAAFNLNKPEFMMVMHVKDAFFERKFARSNPEMMKQVYAGGQLYIEFNPDNSHVLENPYYLNGDVYAMYFFTHSGQLIICALKKSHLDNINKMLIKSHAYTQSLQFICELKTDDPVLLSFINSGYDTIFDYLSTT